MISTVLVATDGSEAAKAAEEYGCGLAARMRARMIGLSVVEDRYARGLHEDGLGVAPPPLDAIATYLKSRADAACSRLAERARTQSVDATCETSHGIADDHIVERGKQTDVIVVGRDGQHGAYRSALIGSTVDGVIRKTDQNAIVVPPGAPTAGPIVLAFDGSPGAKLGATLAMQLSTRMAEPIHVFVDSKDKGRAAARFNEVRALLGALPAPIREISSTLGRPDVKIVDSAREVRAGIIVMGAYGRNRITDYFLGSNAAAVVRTSPVAVLLAR
jgi:nucleotide-binding universal stress UspA family protein